MACCPFLDSGDHLVIISLMEGWVREDRTGKKEGFAEGLGLLPFWLPQTCFSPGSDSEAGLIPGTSLPTPEVMLCLCSEL